MVLFLDSCIFEQDLLMGRH